MENTLLHLWCLTIGFSVLDVYLQCCAVSVEEDFFSFGLNASDHVAKKGDDGNFILPIPRHVFYPFFGRNLPNQIYININGFITFEGEYVLYFDLSSNHANLEYPTIIPFWGDVDTRGSGQLFYRSSFSDRSSFQKANELVRRSFLKQKKFEALSIIVITWLNVGYYKQQVDLVNTYQCVLVSNSKYLYAIFLYADIQWTSSTGSSPYAQAGFSAGDQVHGYSLPDSGTSSVYNLDENSNVGVPGMWVYQISGNAVVSGGCMNPGESSLVPIVLEPSYGNELGGTLVSIQGHCFLLEHRVQCDFEGVKVTAMYENEFVVHCVVPRLLHRGDVPFQLFVDNVMRGESIYAALSMESTHQVDFTSSISSSFPVLFSIISFQLVTLTWNPTHVIPTVDIKNNPFSLDVFLYTMDTSTGIWELRTILAENIINNGSRTVTLPAAKYLDIQPLAIHVSNSLNADILSCCSDQLIPNLFRSMNQIGVWTSQYYYVNPDLTNQRGRDKCSDWYRLETAVSSIQIPCPPTVDRARLPNSGLIETNFISMSGNTLYGTQWLNTFHRGARHCFRQIVVVNLSDPQSPTQQECCYQSEGNLITGPPNGGTTNKVAADYNAFQHFKEDTRPYILCCTSMFPSCRHYYERRPSSMGIGFNPIPPAWLLGGPHFITFDHLRYTFNGRGEFILIQTPQDTFTLQGRMVSLSNSKASTFSAIVAKVGRTGDRILIVVSQAGPNRGGLDVYLNGMIASHQLPPQKALDGFMLRTSGTGGVIIHFSNGVYLECRTSANEGVSMTVIIGVPFSFQNKTRGLLGIFNNDQSDDFTSASNLFPISINSNLQTIHFTFGLSWLIMNSSNSLFSYFPYESFSIYLDGSFQPVFEVNTDSNIMTVCLEDPFCVYDWTITGNMRFGLDTLLTVLEVEQMMRLSKLISCKPLCNKGVCLPNNTCTCSQGYTGPRCETSMIQDCFGVGLCLGEETCELHAGSYTCLNPNEGAVTKDLNATNDGMKLFSYYVHFMLAIEGFKTIYIMYSN